MSFVTPQVGMSTREEQRVVRTREKEAKIAFEILVCIIKKFTLKHNGLDPEETVFHLIACSIFPPLKRPLRFNWKYSIMLTQTLQRTMLCPCLAVRRLQVMLNQSVITLFKHVAPKRLVLVQSKYEYVYNSKRPLLYQSDT